MLFGIGAGRSEQYLNKHRGAISVLDQTTGKTCYLQSTDRQLLHCIAPERRVQLVDELNKRPLQRLRQLYNRPGYIDRIKIPVHRDYIDESLISPTEWPANRAAGLSVDFIGEYLHISVMGEMLDHDADIEQQIREILFILFLAGGVVPLRRRGYLHGCRVQDVKYSQNRALRKCTDAQLFSAFYNACTLSILELAFGFHSDQPIERMLETSSMWQANPMHACYYTGRGGKHLSNGKYDRYCIRVYDAAVKNNLKLPAPKIEMEIRKDRFRSLSLSDLQGTGAQVLSRQERRVRREFAQYVQVRNCASIGNEYLLGLLEDAVTVLEVCPVSRGNHVYRLMDALPVYTDPVQFFEVYPGIPPPENRPPPHY